MKKLYIIILLLGSILNIHSQCMMDDGILRATTAESVNWDLYSEYTPEDTPVKYVRISFHVFQKTDGSGNFPDDEASRNWLSGTFLSRLNNKYSNIPVMNLNTHSPHYRDARVQFVLGGIYFWKDDYAWDFSCPDNGSCNITNNKGNNLYSTYIRNRNDIANKDNSVHVFMGEGGMGQGRASGFGDKKYIVISGVYSAAYMGTYLTIETNLLAHELGHSMGLYHTWGSNDLCTDTPTNSNGWNSPDASNNMMDYNACQCALTSCQINRIHYHLLGNAGNISDCVVGDVQVTSPPIKAETVICNFGSNIKIEKLQFGVTSSWSVSPTLNITPTSGSGSNIMLKSLSSNNSMAKIVFNFGYGKHGSMQASSDLVVGQLIPRLIRGSLNGVYYGSTINNINGNSTTISNGKNATFIYSESISFNSGFSVEKGGELDVKVYQNCPRSP